MNKRLHCYAIFVAAATVVLILAGGLVKSTGSSLAVPDWPLSFGQFFPKMEGGVLYEHGHRMIAGTVGILTFILAVWLWRAEPRGGLKYFGIGAAAAVCVQALLGGITVLYQLPVVISVSHATLAQIFLGLVVSIAALTGPAPAPQPPETITKLKRLGSMTIGFILLQLIAGAIMRNTGKGLHAHLLGAVLVALHVQLLARRVLRTYSFESGMGKIAALLPVLIAVQLVLGYISWRTGPVAGTTAHVGVAALILAGSVALTVQAFRREPA